MTSLTLLMIVEDEFQITHTYVKELWGQFVARVGGDPESTLKLSDTLHVQPCQTNVVDSWWRTHNQSYSLTPSTTLWNQMLVLRIWEGGNPEWIINQDFVEEIHDPTSSMPRLCLLLAILTLPPIVHLRRGRPVNDSPSGPLDDDQIPLFTSDFDVFIGGVTNWSNSC